jgi:nuclear transport factor 2 (NTF2) superfamily protein
MDPHAAVQTAVTAYRALNLDKIMDLFAPDVEAYWNGEKIASNRDELRNWHATGIVGQSAQFDLTKTLALASGDMIGVRWHHLATLKDGQKIEGFGHEFWTMANGQLKVWHAVCFERPLTA